MKEYFVARALARALSSIEAFTATRELLMRVSIQPEIARFFRMVASVTPAQLSALSSLVHSARTDFDSGLLGGGAISLYHAAGGQLRGLEWQNLSLDGALLGNADLSHAVLRGSSLRGANLSSADLTGTDMRGTDVTGANLDTGQLIIDITPAATPDHYLALTSEGEILSLAIEPSGDLHLSDEVRKIGLDAPIRIFLLGEDAVLAISTSEIAIFEMDVSGCSEVARFRVASNILHATLTRSGDVAVVVEVRGVPIAIRIAVETARLSQESNAPDQFDDFCCLEDRFLFAGRDGPHSEGVGTLERLDIAASSLSEGDDVSEALLGTLDGAVGRVGLLVNSGGRKVLSVTLGNEPAHNGAVTAVAPASGGVISSGMDGTIVLSRFSESGVDMSRLDRRLRCAGALVADVKGTREQQLLIHNGALVTPLSDGQA
jgi:hypothetical protein